MLPAAAGAWPRLCCITWPTPGPVVVSPDGGSAYAPAWAATLQFSRDTATGKLTLTDGVDTGGDDILAMSPDGRFVYQPYGFWGKITIWQRDLATGALTQAGTEPFEGFDDRYYDALVSPDGAQLYVSNAKGLWIFDRDPDSGALTLHGNIDPVDDYKTPAGLAMSADSKFLYAAQPSDGGVSVYSRSDDGDLTEIQAGDPTQTGVSDVVLSPDGSRVYGGPIGPYAYDRDPATGLLTTKDARGATGSGYTGAGAGLLAVSHDGAHLYALDAADRSAHQHDLYQYAVTSDGIDFEKVYDESDAGLEHLSSISESPDGKTLYASSDGDGSWNAGGRVATFRIASDGALELQSIFAGPLIDGVAPWDQKDPKLVINGGDEYTNDPDVTVEIRDANPNLIFGARVSNDADFADAEDVSFGDDSMRFDWTLDSGPADPKRVYADLRGMVQSRIVLTGEIRDRIVLDQNDPEVTSAKLHGRALSVHARDNRSGVRRMQVTRNKRHPGRKRAFKRQVPVKRGAKRVYVRVFDGAGNHSPWRSVKR